MGIGRRTRVLDDSLQDRIDDDNAELIDFMPESTIPHARGASTRALQLQRAIAEDKGLTPKEIEEQDQSMRNVMANRGQDRRIYYLHTGVERPKHVITSHIYVQLPPKQGMEEGEDLIRHWQYLIPNPEELKRELRPMEHRRVSESDIFRVFVYKNQAINLDIESTIIDGLRVPFGHESIPEIREKLTKESLDPMNQLIMQIMTENYNRDGMMLAQNSWSFYRNRPLSEDASDELIRKRGR